jgi:hypothetical protein
MTNELKDYTEADLLAVIMSPHTTPDQKRDANMERARRTNQ